MAGEAVRGQSGTGRSGDRSKGIWEIPSAGKKFTKFYMILIGCCYTKFANVSVILTRLSQRLYLTQVTISERLIFGESRPLQIAPKRTSSLVSRSKVSELSPRGRHPLPPRPLYPGGIETSSADSWKRLTDGNGGKDSVIEVTGRPKRLVQAQDNYRHPPGYR